MIIKSLWQLCGSTQYLAPEVLRTSGASTAAASIGMAPPIEGYDMKCDVWSVGVVAYRLLGGDLPCFCNGANTVETELLIMAFAGCAPSSDPAENAAAAAMLDQCMVDKETANSSSAAAVDGSTAPPPRPMSFSRKPWYQEGKRGSPWLAPLAAYSNGYGGDQNNNEVWDSRDGSGVSLMARSFVCACLHPVPERRPRASVLLHHPWLKAAVTAATATATAAATAASSATTASSASTLANSIDEGVVDATAASQSSAVLHTLPEESGCGADGSDDGDDDDAGAVLVGDSDDVLVAGNESKSPQTSSVAPAAALAVLSAPAVAEGGERTDLNALPRLCSDTGVGSASVTPVSPVESSTNSQASPMKAKPPVRMWRDGDDATPVTSPVAAPAASAAASAAAVPSLELDESTSEWWEGVLQPNSALLCTLTKKPFEDPVSTYLLSISQFLLLYHICASKVNFCDFLLKYRTQFSFCKLRGGFRIRHFKSLSYMFHALI